MESLLPYLSRLEKSVYQYCSFPIEIQEDDTVIQYAIQKNVWILKNLPYRYRNNKDFIFPILKKNSISFYSYFKRIKK